MAQFKKKKCADIIKCESRLHKHNMYDTQATSIQQNLQFHNKYHIVFGDVSQF